MKDEGCFERKGTTCFYVLWIRNKKNQTLNETEKSRFQKKEVLGRRFHDTMDHDSRKLYKMYLGWGSG